MEGYIEIEKYRALEAQSAAKIAALTEQLNELKFQLDQLKRLLFGASSERYIPQMADAPLAVVDPPSESVGEEEKISVPAHDRNKVKAKKHPIRLVLPEHLKREEQTIEPPGVDLTTMVRIGEERTETLYYKPAELTIRVIIRPGYISANRATHIGAKGFLPTFGGK